MIYKTSNKKSEFFDKRLFFEMKILHLLNVYQKSIKRKSKNIYENENVLIKRNYFEIYATDCKVRENRFRY